MLEAIPGSEGGLPGTLVVNARGLSARQVAAILEKGRVFTVILNDGSVLRSGYAHVSLRRHSKVRATAPC